MRILSSLFVCLCLAGIILADPATKPATENIVCSGTIVDAAGNPIEGAVVRSYEWNHNTRDFENSLEMKKEITTKADGKFIFDQKIDLTQNYYSGVIVAKKDGLALGWNNWHIRSGVTQKIPPMKITLAKPTTLAGNVVDSKSEPVANAKIYVILEGTQNSNRVWLVGGKALEWSTTKSDDKGNFRFGNIPENAKAAFIANAPGRAKTLIMGPTSDDTDNIKFLAGQEDIKIVMPVEAKIKGKVINSSDGKGVGNIELVAAIQNIRHNRYQEQVTTEADGTFTINGLQDGQYKIALINDRAKTPEWIAEPITVETTTGETSENATIKLTKGGYVDITVVDSTTKQPVENAYVYLDNNSVCMYTNEKGIARFHVLPGTHKISHYSKSGYNTQYQQKAFEVTKDKIAKVNLTLSKSPVISGTVIDQAGKPVSGVSVKSINGWGQPVVTSKDGKFQITIPSYPGANVPSNHTIIARLEKENLVGLTEDAENGKTATIKLQPGGTFQCHVTDSEDKPISQASIYVMIRCGNRSTTIASTKTDKDGNAEFSALPTGQNFSITASADKYGQKNCQEGLDENETQPVKIELSLPDATLSVAGMVVDEDDSPIANADVSVYGNQQTHRQIKTDKKGKFVINNIVDGTVQINAHYRKQNKYVSGSTSAQGGDDDIIIVLGQNLAYNSPSSRPSRSLIGKPLGDMTPLGLEATDDLAKDKKLLLCFWNYNQRPSRHIIKQLAKQTRQLADKGISIITVETSSTPKPVLDKWMNENNITFKTCQMSIGEKKARRIMKKWCVDSLPWIILTDKSHKVQGEGLKLGEL